MNKIIKIEDEIRKNEDFSAYQEKNANFHFEIVKALGNTNVTRFYSLHVHNVEMFQNSVEYKSDSLKSFADEHEKIITLIKAEDTEEIYKLMKNHIRTESECGALSTRTSG